MSTSLTTAPAAVKSTRKKQPRTIRWMARLENDAGVVRITEGEKVDLYYFTPMPSDFGKAYRWEKVDRETGKIVQCYDVNTGGDGHPATCECAGHLRWSHKTMCRHLAAIPVLLCTRAAS